MLRYTTNQTYLFALTVTNGSEGGELRSQTK
jgi:hypothetical protein